MGFGVLVPQRAALLTVLGVLSARPLSDFTLEREQLETQVLP